jgi:hypothetical protein
MPSPADLDGLLRSPSAEDLLRICTDVGTRFEMLVPAGQSFGFCLPTLPAGASLLPLPGEPQADIVNLPARAVAGQEHSPEARAIPQHLTAHGRKTYHREGKFSAKPGERGSRVLARPSVKALEAAETEKLMRASSKEGARDCASSCRPSLIKASRRRSHEPRPRWERGRGQAEQLC